MYVFLFIYLFIQQLNITCKILGQCVINYLVIQIYHFHWFLYTQFLNSLNLQFPADPDYREYASYPVVKRWRGDYAILSLSFEG